MLGDAIAQWSRGRALREIARGGTVANIVAGRFGRRYIVDGWLIARSNTRALVRTVWIVEQETEIPRFVTAYPGRVRLEAP